MGNKPRCLPAALYKSSVELAMIGGDGPDTLFINGFECLHNMEWHLYEDPHPYIAVYGDELKRQLWMGNPVIFLFHNNRDVGGRPTNSPYHWFRSQAKYHGDANYLEIETPQYVSGSYISGGAQGKWVDGKIAWENEEERQRRILGSKYVEWDPVEASWSK